MLFLYGCYSILHDWYMILSMICICFNMDYMRVLYDLYMCFYVEYDSYMIVI